MAKVKILVVEDEFVIANDICETLEDFGYEMLEPAINYTEALEILKEEQPDIAILDIQLAGKKDGIDLAKVIKEEFDIPFIFLTSNSDPLTLERVKSLNPPAFLVKPFNRNGLYSSIEIALHNYQTQQNQPKEEQEEEIIIKGALFIKEKELFYKVKFTDVSYIKSDHVYLEIWTVSGRKFVIRSNMASIEFQLPPQFYRTHRSYFVNLDYMEAINSLYVIVQEEKIPIGKNYRDELMQRVNIH
jgi:DNA-binding LytR/AlgR family response regulator